MEAITVPIKLIDTGESISLGLRQEFFSLSDDEGDIGRVLSTAGFGGKSVIVEWRGEQAKVDMLDLLRAFVAERFPDELNRLPGGD